MSLFTDDIIVYVRNLQKMIRSDEQIKLGHRILDDEYIKLGHGILGQHTK